MRIVIEIDPTDTGNEAGPQVPTLHASTENEVASSPPDTDSMVSDAGKASSFAAEASITAPEAPPELLAQAEVLNALDAGPAPGLTAPSPLRRLEVTQADSHPGVAELRSAPVTPSPCGGASLQEGRVINAGPAPK